MSDFIWKGRKLATMGDVIGGLDACQTPEEARAFLVAYEAVSEHARANLGYGTGYLDAERGQELREWMATPHPVFGMASLKPGEAFALGLKRGGEAA